MLLNSFREKWKKIRGKRLRNLPPFLLKWCRFIIDYHSMKRNVLKDHYFFQIETILSIMWWMMPGGGPELRTSVSMEVDLSVTPFRRWKKCHFNSNSNRRFSSSTGACFHWGFLFYISFFIIENSSLNSKFAYTVSLDAP